MPFLESLMCPGTWEADYLLGSTDTLRMDHSKADVVKPWSSIADLCLTSPSPGAACTTYMVDLLCHERLQNLNNLQIVRSQAMNDDVACVVAGELTKLRSIDLTQTGITGVGVKQIVQGCKELETLNISLCGSVGADAIEWARKQGLRVIYSMTEASTSGRQVRQEG